MRGVILALLASCIPAAMGSPPAPETAYDEFFFGDTDGLFRGPCHAGAIDITSFLARADNGFLVVEMTARDLDSRRLTCDHQGVEPFVVTYQSHHAFLSEAWHHDLIDPGGACVGCEVFANLEVHFEAERDHYGSEAGFWSASAEVEFPATSVGVECTPSLETEQSRLVWRLPLAARVGEFGCDRDYSIGSATLQVNGLSFTTYLQDEAVAPPLDIE